MLQTIRDRATGWIAYAIVILISIPFALWGVNEYLGGGGKRLAAEVDGVEITVREWQQEMRRQRQLLAGRYGGTPPPELTDDAIIGELALRSLIRDALVAGYSEEAGYRVSASALAREIASQEHFRQDGIFDAGRYRQILQSQRISPAEFEASIRDAMIQEQFLLGVYESTLVPRQSVEEVVRLREERREVVYAILEGEVDIEVTEEETRDYYERHRDRFTIPERVKIAYVLLDEDEIADSITVTEDEARAFFDEQWELFTDPDSYRVSHIFLAAGEGGTEADAVARADEVMERIRAGEEFAGLARELSNDSLSREQGGDLGIVEYGDLDPEVERILFSLDEGEVGGPVATERGVHILKVTEIERAARPEFGEVRNEVESGLRRRLAERRYYDLTERLINTAYEVPDSLDDAAEAVGAEVVVTDWVSAEMDEFIIESEMGDDITKLPNVHRVAFSPDVLHNGYNSELIELHDGRVLVLRVHEHEPAARLPFEEAADEVRAHLYEEAYRESARRAGEEALKAVREGKPLGQVAMDYRVNLISQGHIERDDTGLPRELLAAIFAAGYPRDGEVVAGGVELPDDTYAIFSIDNVIGGQARENQKIREEVEKMRSWYGEREVEAVMAEVEDKAKIRIYRENLQ